MRDEWTAVSDVGRAYNGTVVTFDEYIKYENAYVNAILLAIYANHLEYISIVGIEKRYLTDYGHQLCHNLELFVRSLKNGIRISAKDYERVSLISRLVLRENMWCKFESGSDFFVHFGYDYYMYIGSNSRMKGEIKEIEKTGLFVEEFVSPYLEEQ